MTEGLTLGEVFWLIADICVVVVLAAIAVVVLIWWVRGGFRDAERARCYCNSMFANADCADLWLNKYYEEKREHSDSVAFYTGVVERKDKKIDSLVVWDEKKAKRIIQLEEQLRENGIEPVEWDFAA